MSDLAEKQMQEEAENLRQRQAYKAAQPPRETRAQAEARMLEEARVRSAQPPIEFVSPEFIATADAHTLTPLQIKYSRLQPASEDERAKVQYYMRLINKRLAALTAENNKAIDARNAQRAEAEAVEAAAPPDTRSTEERHASRLYSDFKAAVSENNTGRALNLVPGMSHPDMKPTILQLFKADTKYWMTLIKPYLDGSIDNE